MIKLIFWILAVNVITNPAAQIAAIFFGRTMGSEALAWIMICLVELVIVAVEFGLLTLILGKMYRQGAFDELVTGKRLIGMVTVANLASFALGFVVPIFVLMNAAE